MKLSLRTALASIAILATLATPAAAYLVVQSFDQQANTDSSNEIKSNAIQGRTTTVLTGLEV